MLIYSFLVSGSFPSKQKTSVFLSSVFANSFDFDFLAILDICYDRSIFTDNKVIK